jgi:hypothetical protein
MAKKLTTEEFLYKSTIVHGDRYDYSQSVYIASHRPITIGCRVHGVFRQTPNMHTQGNGCPKCSIKKVADRTRHTAESFEAAARKVHGDKYSYNHVVYSNMNAKVLITCKAHGDFSQTPGNHVSGYGCPQCGNPQVSFQEFLERAKKAHGNRFDYSQVVWGSGVTSKVTIICQRHGAFKQRAHSHMTGAGCAKCSHSVSHMETEWLDSLGVTQRQVQLIEGRRIQDGFDPASNTVYEFLGDFWHGNPSQYSAGDVNSVTGTTFGELYDKTTERLRSLAENHKVVFIWQSDWQAGKHAFEVFSTPGAVNAS